MVFCTGMKSTSSQQIGHGGVGPVRDGDDDGDGED